VSGSWTTPEAATDLPPRKGPIFRYLRGREESKVWEFAVSEPSRNRTRKIRFIGAK